MSEITPLVVTLFLPIAAGLYLAKLANSIGSNVALSQKNHTWPCTIEREELLLKNYNNELAKLNSALPKCLKTASPGVLKEQENHLKAMLRSIENIDIMSELLDKKYDDQYLKIQTGIEKIGSRNQAKLSTQEVSDLISDTDTQIRALAMKAHSKLSDIETEVTSEVVSDTMKSLGYNIRQRGSLFAGSLKETSMRATVLSGGKIVLDTTSFKGLSCHKEVSRFEQKLKERGIVVRNLINHHERRSGGVVLKDPFPPYRSKSQNCSKSRDGKVKKDLQNFHLLTQNLYRQRQKLRN